jgi:hypothetical protein
VELAQEEIVYRIALLANMLVSVSVQNVMYLVLLVVKMLLTVLHVETDISELAITVLKAVV